MAISFPLYAKIKDRYCITYYGDCYEYVVQLLYLLDAIEKELPGLQIFIMTKANLGHLKELFKTDRLLNVTEVQDVRKVFGYVRELKCDMVNHPVQQLIEDSNLNLEHLAYPKIRVGHKRCLITRKATPPTQSLTDEQVEKMRKFAISRGYEPIETDKFMDAGWVIGPENEALFIAATQGIKTTLVPTGIGTELYKKLFPGAEIAV